MQVEVNGQEAHLIRVLLDMALNRTIVNIEHTRRAKKDPEYRARCKADVKEIEDLIVRFGGEVLLPYK
jgi:hypothetical protein